MTCHDSSCDDDIDYTQTNCVDSFKLIREVKKYPVLYNSQLDGFNDYATKECIWEKINQVLFTNYTSLPISTQNIIKQTVRRRWRTLRTTLARDVKARITNKKYHESVNPYLAEMQFLLPFIKSVYAKVLQSREQDTCRNILEENTMFYDVANIAQERETVDMNIMTENKPFEELNCQQMSIAAQPISENIREEAVTTSNECRLESFHNGYCVTECNAGEFSPSLAYTAQEISESTDTVPIQENSSTSQCMGNVRKRHSTDNTEFQEKLLKLLSSSANRRDQSIQRETDGEDRMFLLSLVSDLKSLPAAKRMLVKAEIVTAIAHGAQ